MAKQIFLSFPPVGQSAGSDAAFLAEVAAQVFTAAGADNPITTLNRSPIDGFKATIADADNSQNTANGMAQGVKDSGGPSSGYKASEVDSAGVVTELTPPVVV